MKYLRRIDSRVNTKVDMEKYRFRSTNKSI